MKTQWDRAKDLALETLRDLVRLDTSNPPGNERIAADYIAEELSRNGIESTIVESKPTRASLVARIKGRDSSKSPLLISSHTDVVPVDGAVRWQVLSGVNRLTLERRLTRGG